MQNRKSEVRAFRLDGELLGRLQAIANRERISENALVQRILSMWVSSDIARHAIPHITLGGPSFTRILGMTNRDGLEVIGADLGKRNFAYIKELHESSGIDMGFVKYMIDVLDRQAHWFKIEGADSKPERLTLRHDYGARWSLFLNNYLAGAYQVVSRDRLKIGISDTYIGLEFPKREGFGAELPSSI
jgi:hypothetical protein